MTEASDVAALDHRINKWTVRFVDPEMNAYYRAAQREVNLRQTKLALLFAILLNSLFGLLDPALTQAHLGFVLALRLVAVNGALLGLIALSRVEFFRTRWPALLSLAAVIYTLFLIALNVLIEAPRGFAGAYMLVVMAIYVLLPFYFTQGCVIGWACSALFVAGAFAFFELPGVDMQALIFQITAANVIGMYALYRTERSRRLDFVNLNLISAQRSRIEDLLVRILPRSIAGRLEAGEGDIVEAFADSSVLFADIVGFTALASRHKPEEMIAFLNEVFSRFDRLVAEHGLEKIKTIGDAYMVAGGVPEGIADHAQRMARLALAMQAAVRDMRAPSGEPVSLRVGIHSGPLVAGVVGDSRFLYDLWGDTVNIASRLEALAEPGRVQVSDDLRQRLDGEFAFEARGEIQVKGKGAMRTWYLLAPEAAAGAAP